MHGGTRLHLVPCSRHRLALSTTRLTHTRTPALLLSAAPRAQPRLGARGSRRASSRAATARPASAPLPNGRPWPRRQPPLNPPPEISFLAVSTQDLHPTLNSHLHTCRTRHAPAPASRPSGAPFSSHQFPPVPDGLFTRALSCHLGYCLLPLECSCYYIWLPLPTHNPSITLLCMAQLLARPATSAPPRPQPHSHSRLFSPIKPSPWRRPCTGVLVSC